ncbi:sigma-70 family RNA polymerase sigma factor [Aquimarina sp. MMG016]|uniref:RNA polymerase sigma factor n=1 Tax=Aquimarina sp. MMG016 TaxID=2822690 RepID=UPI001B39DA29|nr:sigma-70 family RNA polymerase sigma factor [Aquimarina sp. MMG016]MBQ4821400.1 sigma-70 family RNA polymerase sigma factor [Aquimarina sp. MMG016]
MNSTEDHKIIEGIVKGDEVIIKAFYKNNLQYIRSYVIKNSGNEEDVEDVFQDALVVLYQKFKYESVNMSASLRTYFYAICKNIWRNRLRKNSKILLDEEVIEASEPIDNEIIDSINNKEREHLYRKYFLMLDSACKEILNLVFEGNSMKKISTITGYSEGYTRKKKFNCKRSLIEMIEKDSLYQELVINPEKEKKHE